MTPKVSIIIPVFNQEELVIRALDSIPRRSDIEVVVVDDGSTDDTFRNVRDYRDEHPDMNIVLLYHRENKGVGAAKNTAYDNATGEYISELDSDDFLYTEAYEDAMEELDGTDMVYINLIANGGITFALDELSKRAYCGGPCKFIRRAFLGDLRCPDVKAGEDWFLNEDLQAKNPTEKFTGIDAYHYNFPRKGSLYYKLTHKEL